MAIDMGIWSLLGLTPDADVRSIKRRYAQLLKNTRPDEDAEAFQRLRDAYERALSIAQAQPDGALPLQTLELAPGEVQPISAAAVPDSVHEQVAVLVEASPSLDAALQQAVEMQLERELQLYLLTRCSSLGNEGEKAILLWAIERLQWLSPWQADYLPQAHLEMLAARLLAQELQKSEAFLHAGEERAALDGLVALANSEWLQPFERRLQFQEGVLRLLERSEHWSPAFFERLADRLGWHEEQGQLPCPLERWERLCGRCESQAMKQRLLKHLGERWPLNAEQRAAWLLLKPLSPRERRYLVDRFSEEDWWACESLDGLFRQSYPDLPSQLGAPDWEDWQRWQPRKWASAAACYAWLLLLATMLLDLLYSDAPREMAARGKGLQGAVVETLITSLAIIGLLASLVRGWSWLTRYMVRLDLPLSRLLLPASWHDQGAGMLVLRHCIPAAAFAFLVAVFDPWGSGWTLAAGVFVLALLFLGRVGSGGAPWPRLATGLSGLFKVDYSRKAEW
ncbi:hypothetical protein ACNFCK_06235 [Pseudomonas sp. NY15366]